MKQKKVFMSRIDVPSMIGKRVSVDFSERSFQPFFLENGNPLPSSLFEGWKMGVVSLSAGKKELYSLVAVKVKNGANPRLELVNRELIEFGFYLSQKTNKQFVESFKLPSLENYDALYDYNYPKNFPIWSSNSVDLITVKKSLRVGNKNLFWFGDSCNCSVFVLCDKDGHLVCPDKISELIFSDYNSPYEMVEATGKYLYNECHLYPLGVDTVANTNFDGLGVVCCLMKNETEKVYLILSNRIYHYYMKLEKGEEQKPYVKPGFKFCYGAYSSNMSYLDYLKFDMDDSYTETAFVPSRELLNTVMKKQFPTIGGQFERKYWIAEENTPLSLALRNNKGMRPCIFSENGCEVVAGYVAEPLVAFLCDEYGCFLKYQEVDNYEFYTA